MKVIISTRTDAILMEIGLKEPVLEIKQRIEFLLGFEVATQYLTVYGLELIDGLDMGDYPTVVEGTKIDLTIKDKKLAKQPDSARTLNLVVQTASCLLNSAQIPLELMESITIREMRQMLLDEKILPQDDYFFIHKQQTMQDDSSLSWHGVEDGDILYVFKGTVSREL